MPDSLKPLLKGETHGTYGEYGYDETEVWACPAIIDAEQFDAARKYAADLDMYLAPPSDRWIAGRVLTLLAHYYAPAMPDRVATGVAHDWCEILSGLPQEAIGAACLTWLRQEPRKRPSPGNIRELALSIAGREWKDREKLKTILARANTPAQSGGAVAVLAARLKRA